jgi:hypothetical protein
VFGAKELYQHGVCDVLFGVETNPIDTRKQLNAAQAGIFVFVRNGSRKGLQPYCGNQLAVMADGNFDAIGKCVEGNIEAAVSVGEVGESFPANVLSRFGKLGAAFFFQTRPRSLKLHGAVDGTE